MGERGEGWREGAKEGRREVRKGGRAGLDLKTGFFPPSGGKKFQIHFGARVYFMYHYWGKFEQAPH